MALSIVPLDTKHLEASAKLVSRRYGHLREEVPDLPPRYGDLDVLLPMLHDIADAGPGVVAQRDGQLVGVLAGWLLPEFRGHPAVFCPEWANATVEKNGWPIYEAMYTHIASQWGAEGYTMHMVNILAHDQASLAQWPWLGFGMLAGDGVRDLCPLNTHPADSRNTEIDIRRAGPEDLTRVVALTRALHQHLMASPTFLSNWGPPDRVAYITYLQDPAHAVWLAWRDGEAIAYLHAGPANDEASTIIYDEGTCSIMGAYTQETVRGAGIGTALLERALAWAKDAGYTRCAVDFEPMNPPARRFWLRYFTPVCYTFARYVGT
jgi:GNAT superfamily N-acetyltransferase